MISNSKSDNVYCVLPFFNCFLFYITIEVPRYSQLLSLILKAPHTHGQAIEAVTEQVLKTVLCPNSLDFMTGQSRRHTSAFIFAKEVAVKPAMAPLRISADDTSGKWAFS
ncbi:uncharacterized protein F4822DRAFT_427644 [Hypoxylon trugodes]|uniref:uncharacterized protein n=1 Tax=Hypoxylon trugodes TaxID=326681 RepID=UPI00219AF5D5|nr:uncharacterized protein F4822DRAFT_427644 [Hypoxylon trugodes]KAI1389292.1 hypothetical protein F4822DRAFT_427644 [Hypoxylon trugodes]